MRLIFKLRKLRRNLNKARREFEQEMIKARKSGMGADELQKLKSDWIYEITMLKEEMEWIESERLLDEADRLGIPRPEGYMLLMGNIRSDNWEESQYFGWYLSTKGAHELRQTVRAEQGARREPLIKWGTLFFAAVAAAASAWPIAQAIFSALGHRVK